MSNGTWSPGVTKERTGLYNWFVSLASSRVNATKKGVVGLPIKADWGPENQLVICADDSEVVTNFGTGGSVYLVRRALKGGKIYKPYRVVLYRMTTDVAEKANAQIGQEIKLAAKYKGSRGNDFRCTIITNIVDNQNVDVCIYEGSIAIKKYTVADTDIDGLVSLINSDTSSLIDAVKLQDGTLAPTASIKFEGGVSGSAVTIQNYIDALAAFETAYLNTIAMDAVTEESLLTMVKSWHNRVWNAGKMIQLVIGGTHEDDKDPKIGNARSKACDNYGIINVIVGGVDGSGNLYSSSELSAQVAGAIAAIPLNKSLTYKELDDICDVTVALSDTEIGDANKAGSFTLFRDIDPETFAVSVKVEKGINTFTGFTEELGGKLRKIKAISTMAAIDYDTGRYAMQNVLGEFDNDADGQAAMFSGIKKYLETLADEKVISTDILVGLSETLVTEGDVVYMETQALTIDKIEQIFNKIYL